MNPSQRGCALGPREEAGTPAGLSQGQRPTPWTADSAARPARDEVRAPREEGPGGEGRGVPTHQLASLPEDPPISPLMLSSSPEQQAQSLENREGCGAELGLLN